MVTVSGIPYVWLDAALSGAPRLAQRPVPPFAGGDMPAFLSSSGSEVTLPWPLLYRDVEMMFELKTRLGESGIRSHPILSVSLF